MAQSVYPGAVWRPVPDKGKMDFVRGVGFHVAVTRQEKSIFGWVNQTSTCHFFIGRYGYCEQYIEVGRVAWGMSAGNSTMITVESWDGLDVKTEKDVNGLGPNETFWTPWQCARFADLAAWFNVEHGVPIQMMQTSKKSERGFAPHRWGIEPFRTQRGGGEVWTAHRDKQCPGDKRITQIPDILAHARVLAARSNYTPFPQGEVADHRLRANMSAQGSVLTTPIPTPISIDQEEEDMAPLVIIIDEEGTVWRTRDFITKSWVGPGVDVLGSLLWVERLSGRTAKLWTNVQGNELVDLREKDWQHQLETAGRVDINDPVFGVAVGPVPREPERNDS